MEKYNRAQQAQNYDGVSYPIMSLIEASKDLEIIEVNVADLYTNIGITRDPSIYEFCLEMKIVLTADLDEPILLAPTNFILDGKHRVARAIFENVEKIKAIRFKDMPNVGFNEGKQQLI